MGAQGWTRDTRADSPTDDGAPVKEASLPSTPRGRTTVLIELQTFEGSFPLSTKLAELLGTPWNDLEAKLGRSRTCITGQVSEKTMKEVWATVLAVKMFEVRLASEKGVGVGSCQGKNVDEGVEGVGKRRCGEA